MYPNVDLIHFNFADSLYLSSEAIHLSFNFFFLLSFKLLFLVSAYVLQFSNINSKYIATGTL